MITSIFDSDLSDDERLMFKFVELWDSFSSCDSFYEITEQGVVFNYAMCALKRLEGMTTRVDQLMQLNKSVAHRATILKCLLEAIKLISQDFIDPQTESLTMLTFTKLIHDKYAKYFNRD
jgi:hypothetical protein